MNAAVWLGASLFFTFGVAQGVFSQEMRNLLQHPFYPGAVAQILFERFFYLQYFCAGLAIVLYLWESVYRGRKFERVTFAVLIALLAVALAGGLWLQPKLKTLHATRYSTRVSEAEKEAAAKQFGPLHGASQAVNLLVMVGLLFYFWKLTGVNRPATTRTPLVWE